MKSYAHRYRQHPLIINQNKLGNPKLKRKRSPVNAYPQQRTLAYPYFYVRRSLSPDKLQAIHSSLNQNGHRMLRARHSGLMAALHT